MARQWIDSNGRVVPPKLVSRIDKKKTRKAEQIQKKAKRASQLLCEVKHLLVTATDEIFEHKKKNTTRKKMAGNITWYSFDKRIKITRDISSRDIFDSAFLSLCTGKLNEFMDSEISTEDEFVKEMIIDSFQTRRGQVDSKRVLRLLKYKDKVKSKLYKEAMEYLEEGYDVILGKEYYKIYVLDIDSGEYVHIPLSISDV